MATIEEQIKWERQVQADWDKLALKYQDHASDQRIEWNWTACSYNRIALVNRLIRSLGKESASYLEIGCESNVLFHAVCAERKVGVDPNSGGTHRMTSDAFFESNQEKFDVIFVDGLHHYDQVRRDALNAISCLNEGGFVAFHDLLPSDWKNQHVPRLQWAWVGDCWKAAVELSRAEGIDFRIVRIDNGVGVLRVSSASPSVPDLSGELAEKQFDYFCEIVNSLPLAHWDGFLEWLEAGG